MSAVPWMKVVDIEQILPELVWARTRSFDSLVSSISEHLNVPAEMVHDRLFHMSANLGSLLDSPQGWAAIGGFVAASLGCMGDDYYMPVIN